MELDDLAGVRLDGVALRAEDKDGLPFFDQAPRGGNDEFALVAGNYFWRRPVGCFVSK